VRRDEADPKAWFATGITLQGGTATTNVEPRLIRFSSVSPLEIKVTLLDEKTRQPLPPHYSLQSHETAIVQAKVTGKGIAAPGKRVNFRTADPALLSTELPNAITNSEGIAETKIRCETLSEAAATVIAEAEGISQTTTVPVQGRSSRFGLFALLVILLFAVFLAVVLLASKKRSRTAKQ
jgi:hypothetical protein